jgi:hypothetical protein
MMFEFTLLDSVAWNAGAVVLDVTAITGTCVHRKYVDPS